MSAVIKRVLFLSTAVLFFRSAAFAENSRLDPFLSLPAPRSGIALKGTFEAEKRTVLVHFSGNLNPIADLDGVVRSVIGDVATVDIPAARLQALAALPNVRYVEAPRKRTRRLDAGVPATGADRLRSGTAPDWTGNTGRNVVIGIIDTGLDLSHGDFKDKDGKTRVRFLWDHSRNGAPPSGFRYGMECTHGTIDSGTCGAVDEEGHGTHVAGIAAGNGFESGTGSNRFRFIGMAPEADLIIVKLDSFQDNFILEGVQYIQEKAQSLGLPSVINLSLGGLIGPQDGTSVFERALDNASGPGRVIVAAAGNAGNTAIHASGTVPQGETKMVHLNIPAGTPYGLVDLWYPGQDQLSFRLRSPASSCVTPFRRAGDSDYFQETPCGAISVLTPTTNPNNGDKEIIVVLEDGTNPLQRGVWQLELRENGVRGVRFDAYSDDTAIGPQFQKNLFASDVDPHGTLNSPGTATKVISVGSYATKSVWLSKAGLFESRTAIVDAISPFSSKGPRRLCSLCVSVQKPDIAAPGQMVMSSLSSAAPHDRERTDPDGVHIVSEGTSMAAPHVAGAVALLLQASPMLPSDQIKTLLASHAKAADPFTGALPNTTWGFGKLDVKSAFLSMPNAVPASPSDLSALPESGGVKLTWKANRELDLDGYHLYRSTVGGSGFVRIDPALIRSPGFIDTGPALGTKYFYRVSAVDTKGQEGALSSEVEVLLESEPVSSPAEGESTPSLPNGTENPAAAASSSGGGCSSSAPPDFDPTLAGIAALAILGLGVRGLRKS